MQVVFVQDGSEWVCQPFAGGQPLARIEERRDGTCRVVPVGGEPAEFPDLYAAQKHLIERYDTAAYPVFEAPAPAPPKPAVSARRTPAKRQPWRGGAKKGTKWDKAGDIVHYFCRWQIGAVGDEGKVDIRDKSPKHRECYDLASKACEHFSLAQCLSGVRRVGARNEESGARAKGARLLKKAEALFVEIRKADEEERRARLKMDCPDLWEELYGPERR